ncbi:glycosyltransferase family 4 protein [Ornithobacterium rhinotracheale]|uniref:glycosyltransferase family 4 protein n=1 Tax=Ornithobacterium rhinotracheale TaxID=28251 RepID=UPI001FF27DF6|nr:glycosyltransferase family 4 protein [Ornithobacterium rhinotracheale]MCK0199842.1 glycosyltransferase family 4 protein [Ornithobacterium rhinotracheale]
MKVLHLSGSKHHWSGNEQQLADLIENLSALGVENHILCYENSEIQKYALKKGIKVCALPRKSIYSPSLARALRDYIRREHIEVIHAHTSNFLTLYLVADLLFSLKTPTVFSRKGFSEKSSFVSRYKYNYKNIDATICVSGAVRENLKQFVKPENHHKLRVIYDGIKVESSQKEMPDLRQKYQIPQDAFLLGNIANHVPAKDLETLVRTMDYLIHTLGKENVYCVQIGKETEFTPALKALAKELNVDRQLIFAGQIAEAKYYLPQFNAFVMSSQSEGLPLTVYESFLNKIPVVSTKAGGVAEAITDAENGLICEIKDHQTLAQKINTLIENPNLKQEYAEKAYEVLLEKFDAKLCAKNTKDLYQEAIENRKK